MGHRGENRLTEVDHQFVGFSPEIYEHHIHGKKHLENFPDVTNQVTYPSNTPESELSSKDERTLRPASELYRLDSKTLTHLS